MRLFLLKISIRSIQLGVFFIILAGLSTGNQLLEKQIWNLHNFNYGGTNLRLDDFVIKQNNDPNYDVIFLGSSTTYRSVNTDILGKSGIKSFNMGSSQQSIDNSIRLTQWITRKNCIPKIYFLDLNASALSCDGFESTYDFIMANNHVMNREFGMMAWDRHDPYLIITWIYYSIRRTLRPTISSPPDNGKYISGGFIFSNHLPANEIKCNPQKNPHTIGKSLIKKIARLSDHTHHSGSELRFIIPPSPCETTWDLTPEIAALTIDGHQWPLSGVDSMYYDNVHLRGVGAELYSQWLSPQLKAIIH